MKYRVSVRQVGEKDPIYFEESTIYSRAQEAYNAYCREYTPKGYTVILERIGVVLPFPKEKV